MNWLSTSSNSFSLEPLHPRLMSLLGYHEAPRGGLGESLVVSMKLIHWEDESVPCCFVACEFKFLDF